MSQIIKIQIKTDVSVKITVPAVAGITFLAAPNLFGRLQVASKNSEATRGQNGREHAVAWRRIGMQQAMCFGDGEFQISPTGAFIFGGGLDAAQRGIVVNEISQAAQAGKRIFSATVECVAKMARGIATMMAKT